MLREKIDNRDEWLEARMNGIGASESAVTMGLSPFMSIDELYDIKTRRVIPKDISDKPCIQYGIKAEPLIRSFVEMDFPYYQVNYHATDILHHSRYPFIMATLDGELIDTRNGKKGVLEIKSGSFRRNSDLEKWDNGQIPIYYYTQVCQQLAVTGWDFALVAAKITRQPFNDDMLPKVEWRYVYIDAKDANVISSMQAVMRADIKFLNCVQQNIRPSTILRF